MPINNKVNVKTTAKSGSKISKVKLIKALEELPTSPFPKAIKPMLATLIDKPFDKEGWVFEVKWDGYRMLSYINDDELYILSRNLLAYDSKYPVIKKELKKIKYNAVLDGEVVAVDNEGISRFALLQNYHRKGMEADLKYYVFDILWLEGHNIMNLPLTERKEILRQILPSSDNIFLSEHHSKEGNKMFKSAQKLDLEGIMAKSADSNYVPGARTYNWLKIKTEMRQETVICGFTEPRGSRKFFGALILGVYDNGKLIYVGHTGTGFDFETLRMVYNKIIKFRSDKSPFDVKVKTNQPVTWLKPKLVCEIKFSNWTSDGNMRHPVFLGFRYDKNPREVRREK